MSTLRTAGVKKLVEEALAKLPTPYTEDVINDVFKLIANQKKLRDRYDELVDDLGKLAVNASGGQWVSKAVGLGGYRTVKADNGLTNVYAKLRSYY